MKILTKCLITENRHNAFLKVEPLFQIEENLQFENDSIIAGQNQYFMDMYFDVQKQKIVVEVEYQIDKIIANIGDLVITKNKQQMIVDYIEGKYRPKFYLDVKNKRNVYCLEYLYHYCLRKDDIKSDFCTKEQFIKF